jgi:hypothetical protein
MGIEPLEPDSRSRAKRLQHWAIATTGAFVALIACSFVGLIALGCIVVLLNRPPVDPT